MSFAADGSLQSMNIDARFTAVLQTSPSKGGWTYVVWPKSAEFYEGFGRLAEASARPALGRLVIAMLVPIF